MRHKSHILLPGLITEWVLQWIAVLFTPLALLSCWPSLPRNAMQQGKMGWSRGQPEKPSPGSFAMASQSQHLLMLFQAFFFPLCMCAGSQSKGRTAVECMLMAIRNIGPSLPVVLPGSQTGMFRELFLGMVQSLELRKEPREDNLPFSMFSTSHPVWT